MQKTTTIALVVPEAGFTYTGQIINGLLDVAKIYKYNIMLHTTTEGIVEITDIVENIIKSRADGVIIYNDKLSGDELKQLNSYQVPIVVIGNKMSDELIASVYVDTERAVYELATKLLKEQKDRRIAVIEDRKNENSTAEISRGLSRAYLDQGYETAPESLVSIPFEYRSSYDYFSAQIDQLPYDFYIANRDSQALALINSAKEHGIKIPEDLEVVCIIDTKYNSMFRPRLSSFALPSYDLGAVAMRMMTKMLNDEEAGDKEIELSYLYTPRQSTRSR